jgi:tRNA/rRNA methyltransferase
LHYIYATTARPHGTVNRIFTPRAAIPDMIERMKGDQKVAVMFGRERTGLINDHVALASAIITIPLNPEFMSLNLAQAVLLIGYEWYQARDATPERQLRVGASRPATREEYLNFFQRLESELESHGFFVSDDMRPGMARSLQSMLQRAEMTEQEIRTWHGVLSALIKET